MANTKPKRRWYQFSLLTLLIVMLVFSVTVGWTESRIRQARENRDRVAVVEDAVVEIEGMYGWVRFEREELRPQTWLEEQLDDPGGADEPVVGVLTVESVGFAEGYSTYANREHVMRLADLQIQASSGLKPAIGGPRRLLRPTTVTDADLEHLEVLSDLTYLNLGCTEITDAGLEHLKGLQNLQELSLRNTEVTDAGLEYLKELTKLRFLMLSGTKVTDAGLVHLTGLTDLRYLDLERTQVTDEGAKKLQQASPNCMIW